MNKGRRAAPACMDATATLEFIKDLTDNLMKQSAVKYFTL